jgi:hypothetical protein
MLRTGNGVVDPTLEMRRLAGKFAVLLAGVYVLVVFGVIVAASTHGSLPLVTWPLVLLPAFPFVPSVLDAVRLHRTSDPDRMKVLWRRCLLLAIAGTALLIVIAIVLDKVN